VRVVTNLDPPSAGSRGRPRTETVLSQRTRLQKTLCRLLHLDELLAG
jgi:hypothetical protein